MLEGLREVVLSSRGRPLHDIYVNLTSRAPPPWMDNPEEAGVGRWRRVAVVQKGGGEATECGGAVGGDMYKTAAEYVTLLCRKREEPPRGRQALP